MKEDSDTRRARIEQYQLAYQAANGKDINVRYEGGYYYIGGLHGREQKYRKGQIDNMTATLLKKAHEASFKKQSESLGHVDKTTPAFRAANILATHGRFASGGSIPYETVKNIIMKMEETREEGVVKAQHALEELEGSDFSSVREHAATLRAVIGQ